MTVTAPPALDWERLARASMHPTQLAILETLVDVDTPMSPSGLSTGLEEPLGNVSYHMRFLADRGLVRLVRTEPRRGAVEHFYVPAGAVRSGSPASGEGA